MFLSVLTLSSSIIAIKKRVFNVYHVKGEYVRIDVELIWKEIAMKQRIEVTGAVRENDRMIFQAQPFEESDLAGLTAVGQVLADSDQLSFIYILDYQEEFIYANLPSKVWPELKETLDSSIPAYLTVNGLTIELKDLHDELSALLENIKGNANYGEEMERKAVETFGLED